MRALQLVDWQRDPELRETEVPEPRAGEVLLRVGGAGVCHSDLHLLYEFPPGLVPWDLPVTLGHENAGWVERLGPGVRHLEVGQPVAVYGPWACGQCIACARGEMNYCRNALPTEAVGGLGLPGGMAPFMIVPDSRYLVALPDGLTPAVAAPLTDAGLTPYHAIVRVRDQLRPGAVVVVIGAGGLGHVAVQMLRALTDAEVLVIDPKADARSLVERSGAHRALAPGDETIAEVRAAGEGHGAAAALDFVGSDESLGTAVQMLESDGHLVIVGIAGGTLGVQWYMVPRGFRLSATYWGSLPELHEVLALAARGDLHVETTLFDLEQAPEAYAALRAGKLSGRAVVTPNAAG